MKVKKKKIDYLKLSEFCQTTRQFEIFDALIELKTARKAAKKLNICLGAVGNAVSRVKDHAARQGYSPEHDMYIAVPNGFHLKGTSTLYGDDGQVKMQWVKSNIDQEKQAELAKQFIEGLCEEIKPCKPKQKNNIEYKSDLMPSIFIGDAHIGMYAYGKETKHQDFDSEIATQQIRDAIDYLVDKAEPSENGLLVNVGDFLHANSNHAQTYAGTPLDVDTRHDAVLFKAAQCMKYCIDRMLEKMEKVTVVMAKGNHDTDSSAVPRIALKFYYMNEPRVNVLDTDGFYHYIEYGNWLLGVHHGDKQKPESLAGSMARDMPKAWGRTTHRMWCVGHFHKEFLKVLAGVTYRVFAALTPPDSWHASHGFKGDGEMQMLTLRRNGGIHSSHIYNIPQPVIEPDVTL